MPVTVGINIQYVDVDSSQLGSLKNGIYTGTVPAFAWRQVHVPPA